MPMLIVRMEIPGQTYHTVFFDKERCRINSCTVLSCTARIHFR